MSSHATKTFVFLPFLVNSYSKKSFSLFFCTFAVRNLCLEKKVIPKCSNAQISQLPEHQGIFFQFQPHTSFRQVLVLAFGCEGRAKGSVKTWIRLSFQTDLRSVCRVPKWGHSCVCFAFKQGKNRDHVLDRHRSAPAEKILHTAAAAHYIAAVVKIRALPFA